MKTIMKNLAIIPARSGSKGLKDKNIKPLAGKPLMAYSIEAAIKSGCFDEIMVSTDSGHYADLARQYGANVPFLRSKLTSSDTASSWDMVEEVLSMYREQGCAYDSICLLQPTSPLRTAEDIIAAYKLYNEKAELAVVSVCEMEHSPLWCGRLPDDHNLDGFIDPANTGRRQDIAPYFRINGAIYIVNTERFRPDINLYQQGSYAYIMGGEKSVDIDTELDFEIASVILKRLRLDALETI